MRENIAVIGSGMAGLTTAWLCKRAGFDVTIFESQAKRGMDAHTLELSGENGMGMIDVPLRVMSPNALQSVLALCDELAVETFPVDTCVTLNWLDQKTWLRTHKLKLGNWSIPTLGSWRYCHRDSARLLGGFVQLGAEVRKLTRIPPGSQRPTLEEFFVKEGYEPVFWQGLILPLLSTICTCKIEYIRKWPARDLLLFLIKILMGKHFRRLKGGTRILVNRLSENLTFQSGSPVNQIIMEKDRVHVRNSRGDGGWFSKVVIATQANHASFLQSDDFRRETEILSNFVYDDGELVVHQDERFMPENKADWTALNYLMTQDFHESMFTVWVNAVEPSLVGKNPVFQTWNPLVEVDRSKILARVPMQRAIVTEKNKKGLEELTRLHQEENRKVFFCGSWAAPGVPLLESAVRSAIEVVKFLTRHDPWIPQYR